METLQKFTWIDGPYFIELEQQKNGFYTITAREDRRSKVVYAATRPTSDACKRYVYKRIHTGYNEPDRFFDPAENH